MTELLARLALRMALTPAQAAALPLVVERAASHAGLTDAQLIEACLLSRPLTHYLAGICRAAVA